jgi:hypothetical protein
MLSCAQAAELAQWLAESSHPKNPGYRILRVADVIAEAMTCFGVDITRQVATKLLRMHARSRRWRRARPYPIDAMSSRMKEPVHEIRNTDEGRLR